MNPLKISRNVTKEILGRPNTLKLLVAPVLPLPNCLISFLKNNFPITDPTWEGADRNNLVVT